MSTRASSKKTVFLKGIPGLKAEPVIKREPVDEPVNPPPSKKGRKKEPKKAATTVGHRDGRNQEMRNIYGPALYNPLLAMVGEEIIEIVDAFPDGVSPESVKGVVSFTLKRLMLKHLWLTPKEREILVRIVVPYHWTNFKELELYMTKLYSRITGAWREQVDQLAATILSAFKDQASLSDIKIGQVLLTRDAFSGIYDLPSETVLSVWRPLLVAAATSVFVPSAGPSDIWYSYIEGVTMIYLRRRIDLIWQTGGAVAATAGLGLLQNEEFRKYAASHFDSSLDPLVPPLPKGLPSTQAEWAKYSPKMVDLDELIKEVGVGSDGRDLPTNHATKKVLEMLEVMEDPEFDGAEEEIEQIDIAECSTEMETVAGLVLPSVPDHLKIQGELLAALSTSGHIEYCLMRVDVEHEYIASNVNVLLAYQSRLEAIRETLEKKNEDREKQFQMMKQFEASNRRQSAAVFKEVQQHTDKIRTVRKENMSRVTTYVGSTQVTPKAERKSFRDIVRKTAPKEAPAPPKEDSAPPREYSAAPATPNHTHAMQVSADATPESCTMSSPLTPGGYAAGFRRFDEPADASEDSDDAREKESAAREGPGGPLTDADGDKVY